MKLYFVRHGQTNDNAGIISADRDIRDKHLNNVGIAQAERAAERLRDIRFDAIIASPLNRAKQTAEIINQYHDLPIRFEHDLRELDAESYLDADSWCAVFNFATATSVQGVEPIHDFFERVHAVLRQLSELYEGSTILIVAHGGVKHAVEAFVVSAPLEGNMLTERLENGDYRMYQI